MAIAQTAYIVTALVRIKIDTMRCLSIFIFMLIAINCFCQSKQQTFGEQIFLPAIDFGYMSHSSDQLSGGVIVKTSIEYRFRNNNDFFLRLNYDTHSAEYILDDLSTTTNIIKGKAAFTDILMGLGYRMGESKIRGVVMMQAGTRLFSYPNADQTGGTINIEQDNNSIFTTRTTLGLEYYFNPKAALSLDLFQSQIWGNRDFWISQGSAVGFSIGLITALF